MHITLQQKDLEQAANIVSGLVQRAATSLPVLSNLLIEANENGVTFRGTDQEAYVNVHVNATILKKGMTTVPADTFREIVRLLPVSSEVSLEESRGKLLISCDSNEFKLMTLPADDYPQWQADTPETKFQLAQKSLKSMFDATMYALPQKDHRRVLLGIHLEVLDHRVRATATDGKKLARVSVDVPEVDGRGEAMITVPRRLAENLDKALGTEGPVEVEIGPRQIAFRFGNVYFRGNGIEGKYPDCDTVIPREFPTMIPINRDHFLSAARRAGITSDERNNSVVMRFEDNACQFTSGSHDVGAFKGRMALDYTGAPIELAFNYQYLVDTLGKFEKPELRMFIKNSTAPVVYRAKDDDSRLALLMPIKMADIRPPATVDGDDEEEEE